MSFDRRFYNEAENRLSERRQAAERQLAAREAQIEKTHPEIAEVQRELSLTGAKLIRLILDRSENFERSLSELEQENLFLQQKLCDNLQKSGFPRDFLDIKHECKECGDTGIVDGRRCSCFNEIVRQLASDELNRSSMLKLCDFSDFDLGYYDDKSETALGCTARAAMEDNLQKCRRYAEDFHLPCGGIFMRGGTGLGKTHLSLSIANEVIKKGYDVVYGSAPELLRKMERENFQREEGDTAGMLNRAELLIIDDLGAEFDSRFTVSALYSILNNRMNASLPTIVSTNCELKELKERYGERIISRLMTMEQLLFVGRDIRIIKANSGR